MPDVSFVLRPYIDAMLLILKLSADFKDGDSSVRLIVAIPVERRKKFSSSGLSNNLLQSLEEGYRKARFGVCLGSTIAPHALAYLKADAASLPDTSVQSAEASLPSVILAFTSSSMGTVGTALDTGVCHHDAAVPRLNASSFLSPAA